MTGPLYPIYLVLFLIPRPETRRSGDRSRLLSRRSVIATISVGHVSLYRLARGRCGRCGRCGWRGRALVLEDDSTSDCINGAEECLCLDLVAEAAVHILTHSLFRSHLRLNAIGYRCLASRDFALQRVGEKRFDCNFKNVDFRKGAESAKLTKSWCVKTRPRVNGSRVL